MCYGAGFQGQKLRHELAGNSADWEVEKEGPLGGG